MDSALQKQIVVCVDFAVVWQNPARNLTWDNIEKIPTALAYDPSDNRAAPPMAWGEECAKMDGNQVKQCFKAFFGSPATALAAESKVWAPASQFELHRWIRDYLHALCRHVAKIIKTDMPRDFQVELVVWNFSVPGRWPVYPVVANFKQLAEEALSSCLIGKRTRVEILATEAEASAQCVLSYGKLGADGDRYAPGNLVISCDIGGATTDVAISEIVGPGKLASCSKLTLEPRGLVAFEQRFWEHTEEVLRSAGALEPSKWALEITRSIDVERLRTKFSKAYGDIAIRLPNACCIETWQPPARAGPSSDTTIQDYKLCIPSTVFEELLADFIEEIEGAIDEAINVLQSEFRNSAAVIGLCGGGSRMLYLQARLKARYEPSVPVLCSDQLPFSPELATSRGLSLIHDQRELSRFASDVLVGIQTTEGEMEWVTGEEEPMQNSGFKKILWVFTFAGKSREKTVKHKIVAIPAASPAPRGFRDACRTLHSRSWELEVDLYHDERLFPRSAKYTIVCSITGMNQVAFEARLKSDGRQLFCRSRSMK